MRNESETLDVETLYVGAIYTQAVDVDWTSLGMPGEERWSYTEAVEIEVDSRRHDVIVSDGSIVALMVGDVTYGPQEYDEYLWARGEWEDYEDYLSSLPHGQEPTLLSEEEFEAVFDAESYSQGPMMNYWYPLDTPGDEVSDAARIAHLPLALVTIDGNSGLALTGGGMDMSWQICEAFILLGYLPPAVFAELPAMAGWGESTRHKLIIAACKRTFRFQMSQALYSLERLSTQFP
jgi:hypothetical protein